jgi:ubiquinone/menaquinone biosynthesis C-methylase UbiE
MASWYDSLVENKQSYQASLILPNLTRLLSIQNNEKILDLACGQGFFAREIAKLGAKVIGVDISPELVEIARLSSPKGEANGGQAKKDKSVEFHVSPAHKLDFIQKESIDKTIIVLSLQNIENPHEVIHEINRVLKPNGKLLIVLNHPAFRIPKKSSWGWDEENRIQYRRLDGYMTESKEEIQMHPGEKPWQKTVSFHRPFQYYFKILSNNGFYISKIEEWTSNKISKPGPKKSSEDNARREFPLFLLIEAIKSV